MAEHRQEFRRELDGIEAKVIELFAMVAEDLPTATQALLTGNNEALPLLASATGSSRWTTCTPAW